MTRAARLRLAGSSALLFFGFCLGAASPPAVAQTAGTPVEVEATYRQPIPGGGVARSSKAARWSSLSPSQCLSEVARRKLAVKRWRGFAVGVATPMRITGPIGGVRFVTPGGKSPYGVMDCRLALSLGELADILRAHSVVEVRVDNMYRPRARLPGRKKPSQHSYGLAIDMTRFKLEGGEELIVEQDFQGTLGSPVCGPEVTAEALSPKATRLRNLICDAARADVFHHILTPNHDAAHRDHFHLDIARAARSRIIE